MTFKLLFLTSSREKFFNAVHWAKAFDVELRRATWYGKNYDEPRTTDRNLLMKESFEKSLSNIRKRMGAERAFFIEDTSVRIEALSDNANDIPGLDIKYWMQQMDFKTLDKMLKERGNDRRTTVRSDVLLYIPRFEQAKGVTESKPLHFKGQSSGYVSDKEFEFDTKPWFSWLDSKTFNKWFVPLGFEKPISLLSAKEADRVDFRRDALLDMFSLLHDKRIIRRADRRKERVQLNAAFFTKPFVLVVGLPCAGKTTLGILLEDYGYYHLEASDFMRASYYDRHGVTDVPGVQRFAKEALLNDPGIVARQLAEELNSLQNVEQIVVTGFRSPLELNELKVILDRKYKIFPFYIDAEEQLRFRRAQSRDGLLDEEWRSFLLEDEEQRGMGLEKYQRILSPHNVIVNEGSMEKFLEKALAVLPPSKRKMDKRVEYSIHEIDRPESLESAILTSMYLNGNRSYYTTTQIARLIDETFPKGLRTSKNNVSRYFNQKLHPYYKPKKIKNRTQYCLSISGSSKARSQIMQLEIANDRLMGW